MGKSNTSFGELYMKYVKYHGTVADIPYKETIEAFIDQYLPTQGKEKVWILN